MDMRKRVFRNCAVAYGTVYDFNMDNFGADWYSDGILWLTGAKRAHLKNSCSVGD